jgi:capsule polysaccharide export protein KpsE/RkpR
MMNTTYKAEAVAMQGVQKSTSMAGQFGLSTQSGIESFLSKKFLGKGGDITETIVLLLKSNRVLDQIVKRFDLVSVYEVDDYRIARKILSERLEVEIGDRGEILISAVDQDRTRSADIVNAALEVAGSTLYDLALGEAQARRKFFSIQLDEVKAELARAENDLRKFQETTGVVEIQHQAAAAIEYLAKLKALIAQKEVEIDVLHTFMTDQNPEISAIKAELKSLREQAALLESGTDSQIQNFFSTHNMAATGTDFLRKARDVKYYETLYYNISRLYEMARIDEAMDSNVLQVVDKADLPLKKYQPKRKKIVLIAFVVGFLLSLIFAFIKGYAEGVADDEARAVIAELKSHLLFWRKRG